MVPQVGYSIIKRTVQPVYSCCCWRRAPRGRTPRASSKLQVICRGGVGGGISRTSPASAPKLNEEDSKGAEEGEDRPNRTRDMPPIGTSMVSILKLPKRRECPPPPHHEAASPLCACAAVDLAAAIIATNF